MMLNVRAAGIILTSIALAATVLTGCSAEKPADAAAPSTAPAAVSDVTLDEYLQHHGVTAQAQTIEDSDVVRVTVQQPPGWLASDGYQIPNTYVVLTNRRAVDQGFAPNALVIVHKLSGAFDSREAIRRGFVDTQRYKNFKQTRASLDDSHGLPSSVIEGSYTNEKDLSLHVLNRYLIASAKDVNYIVFLSVTTTEAQAAKLADDVRTLDQNLAVTLHYGEK
ncbi:LpqN/LpqT family lipoprotein [Mycobacteroides abscessus subsp. abscessus]|uniref:LpqN/LpqT family lipoprotein n=1 Tax=Mycobacteroides abscessus TaxID=36809 RepID=UPI0019D00A92|nr:LpqN/LpqT family lipoprotein [Mycobacteroides abscessus]MBN7438711.1 LpqN/LpqT family lipoprotein [Mycobacteroides abscessus subsp. abscessus]